METIYWTKPIFKKDDSGIFISTGEFELIKEAKEGYVPDGDGFQVDMNNIKFSTYKKNPEKYEIKEGKLIKKESE